MTMREDFEHWYEHEFMGGLDGPGEWDAERNCYVIFQVHMAWKGYQAAYAAGQRAEREACAVLVETVTQWRGKGWFSTICHETTAAIAAAIRNRKEQG